MYVIQEDGLLRFKDKVVGRVFTKGTAQRAVNISGHFEEGPDFELVRLAFQAARDAAARVDVVPESEYLEAWHEWRTACTVVEELGLTFGEHRIPVESFGIDSNWHLEFSLALWWLMTHGGWANT